jgi:hypothetical protein
MSVFILSDVAHYDGSETLAVFDSLEKAQASALDRLKLAGSAHKDKKTLTWQQFENWWRHDYASMSSYLIEEFEIQ